MRRNENVLITERYNVVKAIEQFQLFMKQRVSGVRSFRSAATFCTNSKFKVCGSNGRTNEFKITENAERFKVFVTLSN